MVQIGSTIIAIIITLGCALSCSNSPLQEKAQPSATEIPFELEDNHIHFQGRVNNSGLLWFSIDTGAYRSLLDRRHAESLGLELEGSFHTAGAGGDGVASAWVKGVSFSLPGIEVTDQTMIALPLDSLRASGGRVIDVVLGYDFFNRFVVEIDYATSVIRLYDPAGYQYHGTGDVIPITLEDMNRPYVRAKISLDGRDPVEGQFALDTGSGRELILQGDFADKHQLLKSVGKVIPTRAWGLGGAMLLSLGRVKQLRLGRFVIESPLTVFPQSTRERFAGEGMAGNIGGAILRRFKVIFDYSRRLMILEPNERFRDPYEYDMSGLTLVTEGPDYKTIKIDRVLDDSPASIVKLKAGDEIIAINDRPAPEIGISKLRQMLKEEGREYWLSVKRNKNMLRVRIKLKRLI